METQIVSNKDWGKREELLQELLAEREIVYKNLLAAYLKLQELGRYQKLLNDNKVVWFTPSELAAYYHKDVQTIRLWFRNKLFDELGYSVLRDHTGHWRVGIHHGHPDYLEFLAFHHSIKR